MTNPIIPYSFVPGTKAKANEVNANFIALADNITTISAEIAPKLNKDFSNITQDGLEFLKENTAPARNIGEIVASTLPLTDAGLHLLDGTLIYKTGIYSDFVDYIAEIYDASASYFCTEADWQQAITDYGVCGKFVYDSVNDTVRLPKITGKLEGTTDVTALGELAEQYVKLPNITGYIGVNQGYYATGAFYSQNSGGYNFTSSGATGLKFDASRSSSVYSGNGTDTKIHEQAIKCYYYIVIATSAKTDIQVDIDEIATDLNGKADVDLTNANPSASFATAMNTAGIRTVVETYVNGTSWYRVYSDGFCEQGGLIARPASNKSITVNLLKSYTDTNWEYSDSMQLYSATGGAWNVEHEASAITGKTTSSFTRTLGNGASYSWQAVGYIN